MSPASAQGIVTSEKLIEQLQWRYATKKFDTKKIPQAIWANVEKSLILTPSSYGLQAWKFFVIENPELRSKLKAASWNQTQVTDASHYVVFTYRNKMDTAYIENFINEIATQRGVPAANLESFKQSMIGDLVTGGRSQMIPVWASRQIYIALGQLMTVAATLGLDACPMEGLDPAAYDELLGLKGTEYQTACACAVGYRHVEDIFSKMKKVRFSADRIIQHL